MMSINLCALMMTASKIDSAKLRRWHFPHGELPARDPRRPRFEVGVAAESYKGRMVWLLIIIIATTVSPLIITTF